MAREQYLAGKLAIVTGAGKSNGIGFAIAKAFAEHGADVVLHYNSNKAAAEANVQALQQIGVQAAAIQGDATQASFGSDLVRETLAAFPGRAIDIIVNNAAVVAFTNDVTSASLDAFDASFHANVRAPFALIQAAVPHLASPGARIINIGSIVGQQGSVFGPFYSATKAANNVLSRDWAQELGPKGITVNTISPGPIATDQAPPDAHELIQKFRAEQYVKRNGTVEEVAIAVLFAAHPDASFFTGQVLAVDGGIQF